MATEDNRHLAMRTNAADALKKNSPQVLQRDTVIAGWLETLSQLTRQEGPEGMALELWFRSLSSFRPEVISAAFEDYVATGSDENDRFWFPAPAQIAKRCERVADRQHQASSKSALEQADEWKRAQESMSPEERAAYDAELATFHDEVKRILGLNTLGEPLSDAELEQRRLQLRQQAREVAEQNGGDK